MGMTFRERAENLMFSYEEEIEKLNQENPNFMDAETFVSHFGRIGKLQGGVEALRKVLKYDDSGN